MIVDTKQTANSVFTLWWLSCQGKSIMPYSLFGRLREQQKVDGRPVSISNGQ